MDELVLKYIVKDLKPVSTVDSKHFRNLVNGLDPKYDMPGHTYFGNKLAKIYDITSKSLKAILCRQVKVALTCDFWTSAVCQSYLTVTAHYIDDWNMASHVLVTREIAESHTGENIAGNLKDVVREWNIPNGIFLSTDNASNMVLSAKFLKQESILEQHLPCLGHCINLVAKSCLDKKNITEVSGALAKVRAGVKFFRKTPLARSVFNKKQEALGLPRHSPILDVETIWNSTLDMIKRYKEQEPAIQAALLDPSVTKNSRGLFLDSDQALILEEVSIILQPFKDATELLSKEKNPTMSLILPVITLLRNVLCSDSGSSSVKKMKEIMLKDFDGRFSDDELQTFFAVSAFLDPRFKNLAFMNEELRQVTIAKVKQILSENEGVPTVKKEPDEPPVPSLPSMDLQTSPNLPVQEPEPDLKRIKTESDLNQKGQKKVSFFSDLFITKVEGPKPKDELITKEVDRYISEDIEIPADTNGSLLPEKFDSLDWWKQRLSTYPRLSSLARKYLCCPATSVPSERLFSSVGNLINKKRCCLKPENVDRLLFLHKNW